MSDRNSPERVQRLVDAIDAADRIRSLANDAEVQRWFATQERTWIETVLTAPDEASRIQAVARVHAIRELNAHMTAVDQAAVQASRKLKALKETTNG